MASQVTRDNTEEGYRAEYEKCSVLIASYESVKRPALLGVVMKRATFEARAPGL